VTRMSDHLRAHVNTSGGRAGRGPRARGRRGQLTAASVPGASITFARFEFVIGQVFQVNLAHAEVVLPGAQLDGLRSVTFSGGLWQGTVGADTNVGACRLSHRVSR
jgi:hypothetical protein